MATKTTSTLGRFARRAAAWAMVGGVFTCGLGSVATPSAWAQPVANYKVLPLNPKGLTTVQMAELANVTGGVIRGSEQLAGNEQKFDDFFVENLFPRFTILPTGNAQSFPAMRLKFKQQYVWGSRGSAPAHDRLNQITLKTMGDVALDKGYHPFVRYNAMLMVAELNIEEPVGRTPGKPLPQAFNTLLRAAATPDTPDNVRVAALIGVLRHAEAKLAPADAANAQTFALAMLKTTKPPAGRSPEAHDWLRRQAAETLAAIGDPGKQGEVANALLAVATEAATPLSLRCKAARGLGRLNYAGTAAFPAPKAVNDLGVLAIEAIRRETEEATLNSTSLSGSRLKSYLQSVRAGLAGDAERPGGVRTVAAATASADGVVRLLDAAIKALPEENVAPGIMLKSLADLQATVKPAPAAAAKTAAAPTPADIQKELDSLPAAK